MLYNEKIAKDLKTKLQDVVLKIEEDKEWEFDVVATTEDPDRENEVIKINARDTENWLKNPVVLANHTYTIENIVGKGLAFYTSNGVKRLKGVFSKTNPLGILAKNLYQEGLLKAVSVGFIPLQRNAQDFNIIEKAELLEVSFVAVPCNPHALSVDGKQVSKKLFKEAVEKGLLVEKKMLSVEDTIENKITVLLKAEKNITETSKEEIYVCALFNNEFIYNYFSRNDVNRFDKWYRRGYENKDGAIVLAGEDVEVESERIRVDKKNFHKLSSEVSEIKSILKSLVDDKANEKEIQKQEEEKALSNKEILQTVNKATAIALENLKKLQK